MSKGILVVVSGFSGAGKGTVMKRLLEKYDDYALSVSVTTRAPRPGEEDGIAYFFRSREEFEQLIREDALIEYAQYVENYYGTPRSYVEEQLSAGRNVILEIEIQGAMKVKEKIPEALLVFVTPPTVAELEKRLKGRGTETDQVIADRLARAGEEAKGMDQYDYILVNDDVPDWYIWSCKLIKYMFPKAHAAAYVMMAYRIAWYKVFQPLAYYAAYFSIRATAFSYELMCMGKERLEYYMAEIRKKGDAASKKDQDTLKDMRIVQEMYARGIEFVPIDIYTAKAQRFQIVDGKLMPALATIDGLGGKAADAVVDAAKQGRFLSKDDFRDRTKVSKTVIDLMDDLKLFGDIPQSNQMSLFDFTN